MLLRFGIGSVMVKVLEKDRYYRVTRSRNNNG